MLHDLAVPVAADGSFHIEHLHAGEWVLSVHDSMGRSIHQETVQQGTGQQVMPVIQLGS